jgi:hypothetical protein
VQGIAEVSWFGKTYCCRHATRSDPARGGSSFFVALCTAPAPAFSSSRPEDDAAGVEVLVLRTPIIHTTLEYYHYRIINICMTIQKKKFRGKHVSFLKVFLNIAKYLQMYQ